MTRFSMALPAPQGLPHCLVTDEFFALAKNGAVEIVLADGSHNPPIERAGVRHLRMSGANIFELRRAAISCATNEWILVIEDHGRPLPGLLEAYERAIAANPGTDLFCGGLLNLTSKTDWSWANFLYARERYWPPAGAPLPHYAGTANLLVRKSVIRDDELAVDCGFEFLTTARFADCFVYVPDALIDHIQDVTRSACLKGHYQNGRASGYLMRVRLPHRVRNGLRLVGVPLNRAIVVPLRTLFRTRRTSAFKLSHLPRLIQIGAVSATGVILGFFFGPGDSMSHWNRPGATGH